MNRSGSSASFPEPFGSENIADIFRRAASTAPERIAISWEGEDVTYQRLASMAQCLREAIGIGEAIVGILSIRCPLSYAAVQAVLATGAAFVPMHPATLGAGLARIASQCSLRTVVVGEECAKALVSFLELHPGPVRIVCHGPSILLREVVASHPQAQLVESRTDQSLPLAAAAPSKDQTAYIIFTSGSTGEPKGVRVLHRNAAHFIQSFAETFPMEPTDRISGLNDLSFDMAIQDQFSAWNAMATLVVFPERSIPKLVDFAYSKGVTVWSSGPASPAILNVFGLARPNSLPALRISIFGGEKLTWSTIQTWRSVAPNSLIANGYGLTETTIALSFFKVPPEFVEEDCCQGALPMGRPWASQKFEIRKDDGTLCSRGETGMLWFAGNQVVPGYLDPVKTAERFVERDGEIWFRTGDLVFEDPAGNLFFGGRQDLQAKVQGYLVDLGEIEAEVAKASGSSVVVVEIVNTRGTDEIVCVLPTAATSRKTEIREALKKRLPPYMTPRLWVFRDEFPLNSSGKLDRKTLRTQLTSALLEKSKEGF